MSNEVTQSKGRGCSAVASAAPVGAGKTVAAIASMLPPKLSDDMPLVSWLKATVTTIGEHPQSVLDEARAAILSTKTFAPMPADIIDAILAAYKRLDMPLSEDARRHLAYRKKQSYRYALDANGRQQFAADAKVTTIGFVGVSGIHANMLLEENPEASVADVETAVVHATAILQRREKISIADALDEIRERLAVVIAHRKHGPPEAFCGGRIASMKTLGSDVLRHLRSDYFALSEEFVASQRIKHAYALPRWSGSRWEEAMFDAFATGANAAKKVAYGAESQKVGEDAADALMAACHAKGKAERKTAVRVSLEKVAKAISIIEKARWDDPRPLAVQAGERVLRLHSQADAPDALGLLRADLAGIEREAAELADE